MAQLFANNAQSTLASSLDSAATTVTLASGTGARFPSPSGGDFFTMTLTQPGVESSWEIVRVTGRSGDSLTVVRAQEGTSAASWAAGSKAELRLTAGVLWPLGKIDQSISPTWTGNHDFAPVSGNTLVSAGFLGVGSSFTPAKHLHVRQGSVSYPMRLENTGGEIAGMEFKGSTTGSNPPAIAAQGDGLRFETNNALRLRIQADGHVDLVNDNQELRIGANADLRLYHDGTHSYVRTDTGHLILYGSTGEAARVIGADLVIGDNSSVARVTIKKNNSDTDWSDGPFPAAASGLYAVNESSTNGAFCAFTFTARNSGAELQSGSFIVQSVSGSARPNIILAGSVGSSNSTGLLKISGASGDIEAMIGNICVPTDNKRVFVGAGNDLSLYHDGTNSFLENDTGNLIIRVNGELGIDEVSTTTTAPTAGGAQALPATPTEYVTILINGQSRKFAVY